jgi:hypothetical protein
MTVSRTLSVTCVALAVVSLAACGGSKKPKPTPVPTTSASSSSSTPTPKPTPTPAAVDPLTGGKPVKGSVVVVKIDDTAAGRPQVGVDKADIVYIEQVEGGLTRLAAVFHSKKPNPVGPVRSVRSSDPDILGAYGPVAYVASGGGGDSLPALDASPLKSVINDRGGPGFYRDGGRPVPYNLMFNMKDLPANFGSGAKSIGFTWSSSPTVLVNKPTATSIRTVVGGTSVQFNWDPSIARWVRVINGVVQRAADGTVISTRNVIVQFCDGHPNPHDVDQAGNMGWTTVTVGTGPVVVYRDGHRIDGTWSRKDLKSGTTLKTKAGNPIPLQLGGAWVVLATKGAPLS